MEKYESKFWTKKYDKHVKPSLDYPTEGLGKIFDEKMKGAAEKNMIACWFMNREMGYKELRDMCHRLATFLQKNGFEKGDVVAINLPNCPQYLAANFGCFLAGGVASGCSALLSEDEMEYQLKDSNAKAIVTLDAIYQHRLRPILSKLPNLKIIITTNISEYMGFSGFKVFLGKLLKKIPKGKVKPYPGRKVAWFKEVMVTSPDVKEVSIDVETDLACLQYTGGTTGRPKGTRLTHKNIAANLLQWQNWADFHDEMVCSGFPAFHIAGLLVVHAAVYTQSKQILIANPRDTNHIIEEWIEKKPTILANVPTLYNMLVNNKKSKKIPKSVLDNVKAYVSGAAPFPAEAIRDFEKAMKAENKVLEVYGQTETSPLVTANPYLGEKKIGKVGLPLQDTEIKIVDIETGEPVELGKPGELLFRGPQVTKGYHNKPEATAKTIESDGWLHTGDVGVMDEDGHVQIVDRIKDMIIVSGFKVYSVHVEDVLAKHDDVEIAALIGVPDPSKPGSEIVKCYIMLKEGVSLTEELKADIKKFAEESLSKYEKPKIWEFREELPLTTVGKVLKRELRDENK
ncbi:MAG: AMP-binding protein [Candidatus Helarchaeota archaeon]|nr:AMP-binding protein [Candidatus Helarchaeota archaeon]